jgi:hypothetical protein
MGSTVSSMPKLEAIILNVGLTKPTFIDGTQILFKIYILI